MNQNAEDMFFVSPWIFFLWLCIFVLHHFTVTVTGFCVMREEDTTVAAEARGLL